MREDVRLYTVFARCADTSVAVYNRASNRNMVLVQRAAQQTNTSLLSSSSSMLDFPQVFIFVSVCMCVFTFCTLGCSLQGQAGSWFRAEVMSGVSTAASELHKALTDWTKRSTCNCRSACRRGEVQKKKDIYLLRFNIFRSVEVQVDLLIMYINAIYITYTPLAPIIQILHYISWFVYCWVPLCQ